MKECPSSEFVSVFQAHAGAGGTVSFAQFMALALYHPRVGYYRAHRQRIGRGGDTDFYTASSSGPLFGDLVSAAVVTLLGGRDPGQYDFVEIGAEPGDGVLSGVDNPFAASRCLRLGEPLEISHPSVVFSNELFDAQPFRRFLFRAGRWRELGVTWCDNRFETVELSSQPPRELPAEMPEGYVVDAPFAASSLAEQIAQLPWHGLFVACDYGKSWREIVEATPAGTARAYFRHQQSNDLLARPGHQDLTCHVCWDWLTDALARNGFATPVVERQEAFFVRHAGSVISGTSAAEASRFSPRKQALVQLLHPAHLGQKFQVLHALRFPGEA